MRWTAIAFLLREEFPVCEIAHDGQIGGICERRETLLDEFRVPKFFDLMHGELTRLPEVPHEVDLKRSKELWAILSHDAILISTDPHSPDALDEVARSRVVDRWPTRSTCPYHAQERSHLADGDTCALSDDRMSESCQFHDPHLLKRQSSLRLGMNRANGSSTADSPEQNADIADADSRELSDFGLAVSG